MYFPPEDNETEVIMMPNAEPRVIESLYGHGAGGLGLSTQDDGDFIDHALMEFLGQT